MPTNLKKPYSSSGSQLKPGRPYVLKAQYTRLRLTLGSLKADLSALSPPPYLHHVKQSGHASRTAAAAAAAGLLIA
jgi:hypothetical protein